LTRVPFSRYWLQKVGIEFVITSSEFKVKGELIMVGLNTCDYKWPYLVIVKLLKGFVSWHIPHV
jgi:hypothetical protein